ESATRSVNFFWSGPPDVRARRLKFTPDASPLPSVQPRVYGLRVGPRSRELHHRRDAGDRDLPGDVARDRNPVRLPDLLLRPPPRRRPAESLERQDQCPRGLALHECTAEEAGQIARQLLLEARACGSVFGPDQPLDDGTMREEAGSSAGIARGSRGGDLHAAFIGASRRSGNPWRE